MGELCESCGLSLEAFPLCDKQELMEKFAVSAEFRKELLAIRTGVHLGKRVHKWRAQEVRSNKLAGLRIVSRASFVPVESFKSVEKCYPADLRISCLRLIGPDGQAVEGFMVRDGTVPPGVPHHSLEFFQESHKMHGEWLMQPEQQQREAQGAERYTLACKNMLQGNMMSRVKNLDSYTTYREAAASHNSSMDMAGEAVRVPDEVEMENRSGLADDSLMAPPPVKRSQGGAGAGRGRGKASKSRGGRQLPAKGRGRGSASEWSSIRGSSIQSSKASVASSAASTAGGRDPDIVFSMDAGSSEASVASQPASEEESFLKEIQQVLAGEQLGRQMRKVALFCVFFSGGKSQPTHNRHVPVQCCFFGPQNTLSVVAV